MRKVADYIDGCFVEIYEKPVKNEARSEAEGVPVFEPVPYVKIKPTNSKDVFDQPLSDDRKRRYSALFAKFEAGESNSMPSGWLISEWAAIDATQVETLKSAGIYTVEMLAELPENGMHRLPGGYITLKQKAQKALSEKNSSAQVRMDLETMRGMLESKLAEQAALVALLQTSLDEVLTRLSAVEQKPKSGRPKAVEPKGEAA